MRQRGFWGAALLLACLLTGCNRRPVAEYTEEKVLIEAAPGARFTIAIPSNASTGYQWIIGKPLDNRLLELIGREEEPPRHPMPGAPGTTRFRFRAVAPGEGRIVLHSIRPWETKEPGRVRIYQVAVHETAAGD